MHPVRQSRESALDRLGDGRRRGADSDGGCRLLDGRRLLRNCGHFSGRHRCGRGGRLCSGRRQGRGRGHRGDCRTRFLGRGEIDDRVDEQCQHGGGEHAEADEGGRIVVPRSRPGIGRLVVGIAVRRSAGAAVVGVPGRVGSGFVVGILFCIAQLLKSVQGSTGFFPLMNSTTFPAT